MGAIQMRIVTLAMIFAMSTQAALAKPPLREVAEIDDALLAVGLADEIRKNCPSISARMLKALVFVRDLQNQARSLGYTDEEIDAYRKSDSEKARLRAEGAAWLTAQGVTEGNPESYCAAGRSEIEKQSPIGAFLKAD